MKIKGKCDRKISRNAFVTLFTYKTDVSHIGNNVISEG